MMLVQRWSRKRGKRGGRREEGGGKGRFEVNVGGWRLQ